MHKTSIAIAAAVIALQGCAPTQTSTQVAAEQFNEGVARTCNASALQVAPGGTANSTISMTNDGWCALRTTEADGQAFQLGLVRTRPAHGFVLIRRVSGRTRIEYTPNERYVGTDSFTVALRSRTASGADATVHVAVTVAQGEIMAPAPAPAPAPGRTTTPARRPRS